MTVHFATNVGTSKLKLAYETFGAPEAPPVLLIMGLNAQMLSWHEDFCEALAGRGLRAIRFDNRDAGLSTHMQDAPTPDFMAALRGDTSSAAYNLSDMAADTVGLLDALGIESAHLVGASMGGYIAQMAAFEHPQRVRSLTSIMANTGNPAVGQPHPETSVLFAGGPIQSREDAIERAVLGARVVGSPAYPADEDEVRHRAALAYDRDHDPLAIVRQSVAVLASGDRTARLGAIRAPALVIHGDADKMCDVSGGIAVAQAIPGARLVIIPGMGHNLPRPIWPQILDLIAEHIALAEEKSGTAK